MTSSTLSVARIVQGVVSGVSWALAAGWHPPNLSLCMVSGSYQLSFPLSLPIAPRWHLVSMTFPARPGDSSGGLDRSECHHKDERDMSILHWIVLSYIEIVFYLPGYAGIYC